HSSHKVDEEILHGVIEADIQIPAKAQTFPVHRRIRDIPDNDRVVASCGVQHDRTDGVQHGVLLHIQQKELIHGKLKKLPHNADGHGKTESHNGHKDRRELDGKSLIPVQYVHKGKSDGCHQKPVHSV